MRKTKRNILSYFLVLLMICVTFAFEPIPAKAATTHTVTDTESFLQALESAQDGDTINIGSDSEWASINLEEPIEITKDLTINFVSGYVDYMTSGETLPESIVTIMDCDVTIKGNGNFGTGYNEIYAFKLCDANSNTSLTIDSNQFVDDGFLIDDDSLNDFTVKLTINNGSYSVPTDRTTAFNFSEGTVATDCLVVNGGSFQETVSAYLGDNTTVIDNGEESQCRYEVRSTIMSDEFASMLTDGKLVVSSVVPEDEEMDGYAYVMGELCMYGTSEVEYYPQYISDGVWDIGAWDNETGELIEMHRVEVVFEAAVDAAALAVAEDIVDNIPYVEEDEGWRYSPFKITDMEVVNMWANGYDVKDAVCHRHTVNYSGELKEYLGNANVDFRVTMIGAGMDTDLYLEAAGEAVVFINGVMYAAAPYSVFGVVEHIIYVPDGTATDKDSLMAAAQKRIDEYLGSDSKVVVSYGGAYNTLSNTWWEDDDAVYQAEMIECLGLDTAPEHYFIATSGDMEYKFIIIADSDKMIEPSYKTVDATTNVTITSAAAEIPLDTSMRASKLTSGDAYDEIIDVLGVEENITFDLKLYSCSTAEYISSLNNDKFEVSIPVTTELKGKDLMAYYIGDDGKVTKYDVEVVDNYAVFETDHFSIYTIAEAIEDVCDVNGEAHKLTAVVAKDATTTTEGNKAYWTCDCGKWFADAEGTTEITDKTSVVIPKLKEEDTESSESTDSTEVTEDVTTEEKETDKNPITGDNTNVILLFVLMVASAVVLVTKREKNNR